MDSPEAIVRLYLAQRGRCFHCIEPMLMASATKKAQGGHNDGWTREHVVPLSKGGARGYRNVVLAHWRCNIKRGNADPTPEMLARCEGIWERMRLCDRKGVKRIANDPALRSTYFAVYDYQFYPHESEPRFVPPAQVR